MTGWVLTSAAAAALGVVGMGAALETHEQSSPWADAIEIARLMPEAEQAVRVFRGAASEIGVSIRDLNDREASGGKGTGVVIEDVDADGPAQKAGFKARDIVIEFDGERVRSTRQFTRLVQETAGGRSVAVAVMRDGQRVALEVTPRAGAPFRFWDGTGDGVLALPSPKMPPSPPMTLRRDAFPPSFENFLAPAGQLGISIDDLSPQLSEYFGVKEGVLVTTVRDASNAGKAGVKAGDVITALNGAAVANAADLRRRAQRLESGDEFTIGIVRDRKPMELKGKVEPAAPRKSLVKTFV
jgi:serine protease Do